MRRGGRPEGGPRQPASPGCRTRGPHSGPAPSEGPASAPPLCWPRPPTVPQPALPRLAQAHVESLWAGPGGSPRGSPPVPAFPFPHIGLPSLRLPHFLAPRPGRGWRDRVRLSVSLVFVCLSAVSSLCGPCPVLLLTPLLTMRGPCVGCQRVGLGEHWGGGDRGGSGQLRLRDHRPPPPTLRTEWSGRWGRGTLGDGCWVAGQGRQGEGHSTCPSHPLSLDSIPRQEARPLLHHSFPSLPALWGGNH